MRKAIAIALVFALCLPLAACGPKEEPGAGGSTTRAAVESAQLQFTAPGEGDPVAVIETSMGTIRAVLYPRQAPAAVENFKGLAGQGYYQGTRFHRVMKDFVIQGGDGSATGLSGASIWGGPFATERSEALRHYSGALCMAAADGEPDTHLSQFYIVATPQGNLDDAALQALRDAGLREAEVETYRQAGGAPHLDYTDTVFGQVIGGMDVVDEIAAVAIGEDGSPRSPVEILSVTIEGYGPAPQP